MNQKKAELFFLCSHAAVFLRAALIAFNREAKAKNGNARRKARNEAMKKLDMFCFFLWQTGDTKSLHMIADALDGKLRPPKGVQYNDKIEQAVAAIFGGKNTLGFLMNAPFPFRKFKQELARLYRVTPKELTKKTQSEQAREHSYELKEKPSGQQFFDSYLRRTLESRGYTVSGKPGRPKKFATVSD